MSRFDGALAGGQSLDACISETQCALDCAPASTPQDNTAPFATSTYLKNGVQAPQPSPVPKLDPKHEVLGRQLHFLTFESMLF